MSKRMFPRDDISSDGVKINVVTINDGIFTGRIKDLSRLGVSFYSFDNLKLDDRKFVKVSFKLNDKIHTFDMEILRKNLTTNGIVYAGRFKGSGSLLYVLLKELVNKTEQKQLSFA